MLKDYYAILCTHSTASQEEVARAYKFLAKIWHPDRNKAPDATARMQEINEAYLILKDPVKRTLYDAAYARYYRSNARQGPAEHAERRADERQRTSADPFIDEQLADWIADARRMAKEMLTFTIEESTNMLKDGVQNALTYMILPVIIGLLMFLSKACN